MLARVYIWTNFFNEYILINKLQLLLNCGSLSEKLDDNNKRDTEDSFNSLNTIAFKLQKCMWSYIKLNF